MIAYRREIDGLRTLAVIPVILFHANFPFFNGGFVGVDIFFVISGYLISSIIIDELAQNKFSILKFYERRARRILPALFLVMLACIPAAWLLFLPFEFKDFGQSLAAAALFGSNFLFWTEGGYFGASIELKPLIHTWSLAIEEQYYIFFPIFMILMSRFRNIFLLLTLLFIGIVSFLLMDWLSVRSPESNFYLLPTRAWELIIGVFATYLLSYIARKNIALPRSVNEILSLTGILLIAFSIVFIDGDTPFPSSWTLMPVLGTALIIIFCNQDTALGRILGTKLLVSIGLLSYSLYLWHQPIFAFARSYYTEEITQAFFLGLIVASLIVAYVSWRYFENYFRDREKLSQKKIFTLSGVMILFFVSSLFFSQSSSFLQLRYENSNIQFTRTADENGLYVRGGFNQNILKKFSQNEKKKILIIGSSYAQDLFNVAHNSGVNSDNEISTYYIANGCGNYKLKSYSDLDRTSLNHCMGDIFFRKNGRAYENKNVIALIKDADELWLASNWKKEELAYLKESLVNISNITQAKITVFGNKFFGDLNFRELIEMDSEQRSVSTFLLNQEYLLSDAGIKEIIGEHKFESYFEKFCDKKFICKIANEEGYLFSFDGGHLTPEGAQYFGKQFKLLAIE